VAKNDVRVSIEGRRVSIETQASKSQERKDGDRVLLRERGQSSYARSLVLAVQVDQDRCTAKLDNGVLKLELVKRQGASAAQNAIN